MAAGSDYFIGVDVGGTTTTIALGNRQRQVLYVSPQFATRSAEGPQATIESITQQMLQGLGELGLSIEAVAGVGLATPGPATLDGVLLKTPNLDPELWDQFPIRAALQEALRQHHPNIAVHYIGDGQAAAYGEFAVRSGRLKWDAISASQVETELASLFMVIVGTGLGGGAVRDGKPVRGAEGRAGHAGHLLLPGFAFRYEHDQHLLVGNAYCTAESAVSLSGLAHQLKYRLELDEWKTHPLRTAPGTVRDKAKRLRELAGDGDPLALQLFEDQARALGITLLNVNYLGDYDELIIGGGVSDLTPALRDWYLGLAQRAYQRHALTGFRQGVRFDFTVCADNAPVLGALAWVAQSSSH